MVFVVPASEENSARSASSGEFNAVSPHAAASTNSSATAAISTRKKIEARLLTNAGSRCENQDSSRTNAQHEDERGRFYRDWSERAYAISPVRVRRCVAALVAVTLSLPGEGREARLFAPPG